MYRVDEMGVDEMGSYRMEGDKGRRLTNFIWETDVAVRVIL